MPLDPAIAALLDEMAASGAPAINELPPSEARLLPDNLVELGGEGADVASQVEREVGGVPCVVYTPHGDGPFPVLVWIHGGGWVIGGPQHYHSPCRDLAAGAGCIVVSIDYRLGAGAQGTGGRRRLRRRRGVGARSTPPSSAATPRAWRSAAIRRAATCRPWWRSSSALGSRRSCSSTRAPTSRSPRRRSTRTPTGYFLTKAAMEWFAGHYLDECGVATDDPRVPRECVGRRARRARRRHS